MDRFGAQPTRVAVNMPSSGTPPGILKRAMIDVHRALEARAGAPGPVSEPA